MSSRKLIHLINCIAEVAFSPKPLKRCVMLVSVALRSIRYDQVCGDNKKKIQTSDTSPDNVSLLHNNMIYRTRKELENSKEGILHIL